MMDEPRAHAALHEIRTLELEMANRLEQARASASARIDDARAEARRTVTAAREAGTSRADERHRTRLGVAEAEALRIRAAGEAHASELLERLRPLVRGLVDEMVAVVLTTARAGPLEGSDESGEGW